MPHIKQFHKTFLVIYLLFLTWLVLFKFSANPFSVLAHYQHRSLNPVPFAGFSARTAREMVDNFVVFVPFGLLLGINFKHVGFWQRIVCMLLFSTLAEIAQFVFAIGTTDITDVIMNTSGGLGGLAAYRFISKYVDNEKLDLFITTALAILLLILTWLRFMVFRVRY